MRRSHGVGSLLHKMLRGALRDGLIPLKTLPLAAVGHRCCRTPTLGRRRTWLFSVVPPRAASASIATTTLMMSRVRSPSASRHRRRRLHWVVGPHHIAFTRLLVSSARKLRRPSASVMLHLQATSTEGVIHVSSSGAGCICAEVLCFVCFCLRHDEVRVQSKDIASLKCLKNKSTPHARLSFPESLRPLCFNNSSSWLFLRPEHVSSW